MLARRRFAGFGFASLALGGAPTAFFAQSVIADDRSDLVSDLAFNDTGLTLFPGVQLNHSRKKSGDASRQKILCPDRRHWSR